MISLTIQDTDDVLTLDVELEVPLILSPVINETDVETIDGNISTYFGAKKRNYEFSIAWLDQETYARLLGFRDRQYTTLKYPVITIVGSQNLDVSSMTAKMTLNEQRVTTRCGRVESINMAFRESKQLS